MLVCSLPDSGTTPSHFPATLGELLVRLFRAVVERAEYLVPRHVQAAVVAFEVAMVHLVVKIAQGHGLPVLDQQAFEAGM